MKKIKNLNDVSLIIKNKSDIRDDLGKKITFISFLRLKLIDIIAIVENGEYTFETE